MLRFLLCVLALAAALPGCHAPRPSADPEALPVYRVVLSPDTHCAEVIWTLPPADQAQVLKLSLPQGHSFVRLAEPLLREVRLVDAAPGERLERQGQGWSWFRTAGRTGQLRWTVPLEHRDLPDVQASGSAVDWPYSDENHALLSGATLFLMPEGDSGPSLVQFETPDGWARWTPWAEQADGRYFVADSADLASAYLCAGQWTETRLSHGDFQASLLIWPGQAEALAPLAEDLQPLLEELAAYREWNPDKRHLLILSRPDLMGLGGSLVGRCLPMGVQAGLEGARKEICHLPAHECLHLLGAPRVPLGADLRWLVEGGTEFLAWRMLGKAGQAGALERFLAEVDLWAQGQAPVWDRSLADMGGAVFFEGGAEYDAIYRAGAMVSAWLHMALQGAGWEGGLVDLWRRLPPSSEGELGFDGLLARLGPVLGPERCAQLEHLVRRPWAPVAWLPALQSLAPGPTEHPQAEEFLVRANWQGNRIAALDPSSTLAGLGLVEGDVVLAVGDIPVAGPEDLRRALGAAGKGPLELTCVHEGREVVLRWQPVMRRVIDWPQGYWR